MKGRQKMTDKEIIQKVKDWLKSNLDTACFNLEINEDNKALLEAIEDWQTK